MSFEINYQTALVVAIIVLPLLAWGSFELLNGLFVNFKRRRAYKKRISSIKSKISIQTETINKTREGIQSLESEIKHQKSNLTTEREKLLPLDYLSYGGYELIEAAEIDERKSLSRMLEIKKSDIGTLYSKIRSAGSHSVATVYRKVAGSEPNVPYEEVVTDVAKQLKVEIDTNADLCQKEKCIIESVANRMLDEMTTEQRKQFIDKMEREAEKHGQSFVGLLTNSGGIALVNASGFGVYLVASTVVGAVSNAIGVALPFVFYTAMAKTISVVIGPVGWGFLLCWLTHKVGAPNYKKTVPCVAIVAAIRVRLEFEKQRRLNEIEYIFKVVLPERRQELVHLNQLLDVQNDELSTFETNLDALLNEDAIIAKI